MTAAPLLGVHDLEVEFRQRHSAVRAVDGVSFTINEGEVVGLVGESGSGKSTIGRAILGLTDATGGQITFDGQDITSLRGRRRRPLATQIQVVFQDPLSSLNPRWTIGRSIAEPLRLHQKQTRDKADTEAERLLGLVGLQPVLASRLPRELSGGQRQRVAIARAIALSPRLIVCDEPTSALDLSTQSQTLNLLREMHRARGLSYLFISHDLDVVRYLSDRIVVLYRGQIMETGLATALADNPQHPYTQALLSASPVPDPHAQSQRRRTRQQVSSITAEIRPAAPTGCPFTHRCNHAADVCTTTRPQLIDIPDGKVACHLHDPDSGHPERLSASATVGQVAGG